MEDFVNFFNVKLITRLISRTRRLGLLPLIWLKHNCMQTYDFRFRYRNENNIQNLYINFIWVGGGFPCGSAGKESACNVGDLGSVPGLGRCPGEGKGYPLQYSGLENSMDSIVHGGSKESDIHIFFENIVYVRVY